MKKTKIICSIGPSCENWDIFKKLVKAGMNVARINFSHANEEMRKVDEELVYRARRELNSNIAIMYDTKGPDLRTCSFIDDKISLVKGKNIDIVEEEILGTEDKICFNYRGIVKDLEIGDRILLDDGFYQLIVTEKYKDRVTCKIQNTGIIKSRRGVCIPGLKLDIPFISDEDKKDIKYACEHNGDFLAVSFVSSKNDVLEVKKLCEKYGKPNMLIVSKIESQTGINNLEEIVEVSDYVMVARGDLGIETGVENLPVYQQMMIDVCHKHSKGVIMATQMMNSMMDNIRPTNAEVTDVANAVLSGCDAIMTSGETTIGKYPVETVEAMTSICLATEKVTRYNLEDYKLLGTDIHNTIAKLAVDATLELPIKAIIVSTRTGKTALDIASLRPNAFIMAAVENNEVAQSLALKWGVIPSVVVSLFDNTDSLVESGLKKVKEVFNLKKGDMVIIVGSAPSKAHTNFLKIEEI